MVRSPAFDMIARQKRKCRFKKKVNLSDEAVIVANITKPFFLLRPKPQTLDKTGRGVNTLAYFAHS